MLSRCNVAIIGTPRSASSFLAKFLVSQGWTTPRFGDAPEMSASNFNPEGYFENTFLNLLDDQIIRAHFGLQQNENGQREGSTELFGQNPYHHHPPGHHLWLLSPYAVGFVRQHAHDAGAD